ncbi:hypothetical protein [Aeromicrobium sp. P5_D10]
MSFSPKFVHTTAELEACWRELIEPLGFASRQLFAIVIDGQGEVFPHVINIAECPAVPEQVMVANLAEILRDVSRATESDATCAVLWARPTSGGTRQTDLVWARMLTAELTRVGLGRWPIHVADDSVMRVVAPDDLAA